jgi:hypothetical protein
MTTETSPTYVSTAFYSQYNLILLGGAALFSLASASPLPLLIAGAAELAWLSFGPQLPAFRRHVDERAAGERRARLDDEVMSGMQSMSSEHSSRLLAVGQNISWISMRGEDPTAPPAEREALLELELLRPAFMRLCHLRERLQQRLEEMHLSPPEQQVVELTRAYALEKDLGHRFTLHQGIKLAQKKIEQQYRFADVLRQVEHKLSLVEQSLTHLRSQQQQGLAGPDLIREIQSVMTHVLLVPALEAELEA